MNDSAQWYYTKAGKQFGPVTLIEMQSLARGGDIHPEDLVWHAGVGADWVVARSVTNLFSDSNGVSNSSPAGQPTLNPKISPPGHQLNSEITQRARDALKGRWAAVVGIHLLLLVSTIGAAVCIGLLFGSLERILGESSLFSIGMQILQSIVQAPFTLSFSFLSLRIVRGLPAGASIVFQGFEHFWKACATYFLIWLFTMLWTLLLIVPGIVAGLSYSMAWYILCDEPTLGPLEAIQRSKDLMQGHKWRFFWLLCRFVGWGVLCILTGGIGLLWLLPYIGVSTASFYSDLRENTQIGVGGTPSVV